MAVEGFKSRSVQLKTPSSCHEGNQVPNCHRIKVSSIWQRFQVRFLESYPQVWWQYFLSRACIEPKVYSWVWCGFKVFPEELVGYLQVFVMLWPLSFKLELEGPQQWIWGVLLSFIKLPYGRELPKQALLNTVKEAMSYSQGVSFWDYRSLVRESWRNIWTHNGGITRSVLD